MLYTSFVVTIIHAASRVQSTLLYRVSQKKVSLKSKFFHKKSRSEIKSKPYYLITLEGLDMILISFRSIQYYAAVLAPIA